MFDPYSIESKLIEWVNSMLAYFSIQDLQCAVTFASRTDSLTIYSDKGGEYMEKSYLFRKEFEFEIKNKFKDLATIARELGMRNLEALVSSLSARNNTGL